MAQATTSTIKLVHKQDNQKASRTPSELTILVLASESGSNNLCIYTFSSSLQVQSHQTPLQLSCDPWLDQYYWQGPCSADDRPTRTALKVYCSLRFTNTHSARMIMSCKSKQLQITASTLLFIASYLSVIWIQIGFILIYLYSTSGTLLVVETLCYYNAIILFIVTTIRLPIAV